MMTESDAQVHVVVVSFNAAPLVRDAVASAVHSSLVKMVWVVDNASDLGAPAMTVDAERATVIGLHTNVGFGRASNIGIDRALAAGATDVLLLNQDASIAPGCVEALVEAARRYPAVGVAAPMQQKSVGGGLDEAFVKYLLAGAPACMEGIWTGDLDFAYSTTVAPNAAAWLLTRSCIEQVGGFDPLFFMYGEDVDLARRIRSENYDVVVVPSAVAVHRRAHFEPVDGRTVSIAAARLTLRKTGKALALLKGPGSLAGRLARVTLDILGDVARAATEGDGRAAASSALAFVQSLRVLSSVQRHRRVERAPGPSWLGP